MKTVALKQFFIVSISLSQLSVLAQAEIIGPNGISTLDTNNIHKTANNYFGSKMHITGTDISVNINAFGDIATTEGKLIGKTIVNLSEITTAPTNNTNKFVRVSTIVSINAAGDIADPSGKIIGRTSDVSSKVAAAKVATSVKPSSIISASVNLEGKILNDSTGKIIGQTLPGVANANIPINGNNIAGRTVSVKISKSGYIVEIPSGRLIGSILGAEEL